MIGVQFNQVGGNALALSSVGSLDDTMAGFDDEIIFATEMRVWDGNGYDTYGWTGTSGTDVLEDESMDKQWLNFDLEDDGSTMAPGAAMWIKAGSTGTLTVSGEVPEETTRTVNLAAGFNMLAYPYPMEVPISTFATLDTSMAGFDEEIIFATEMRVWDGNGYDTYGWTGTSGTDILEDSSMDNKWLNYDLEDNGDTLSFGEGFWIKAATPGTLTFK